MLSKKNCNLCRRRYETTEEVKVTIAKGDVECTAEPVACATEDDKKKYKALCAEPSAPIFETALNCTGPHDPADAQCDVAAIQLIYAAAFKASDLHALALYGKESDPAAGGASRWHLRRRQARMRHSRH